MPMNAREKTYRAALEVIIHRDCRQRVAVAREALAAADAIPDASVATIALEDIPGMHARVAQAIHGLECACGEHEDVTEAESDAATYALRAVDSFAPTTIQVTPPLTAERRAELIELMWAAFKSLPHTMSMEVVLDALIKAGAVK